MTGARCYEVVEKPDVVDDYIRIAVHIERWTQDRELADRTVDRIRDFVKGLAETPHRGRRRDDLLAGLRIATFGRRTAVAFRVDEDQTQVIVLRVFYGGEDYEAVLGGEP